MVDRKTSVEALINDHREHEGRSPPHITHQFCHLIVYFATFALFYCLTVHRYRFLLGIHNFIQIEQCGIQEKSKNKQMTKTWLFLPTQQYRMKRYSLGERCEKV